MAGVLRDPGDKTYEKLRAAVFSRDSAGRMLRGLSAVHPFTKLEPDKRGGVRKER
jgi:hypothetical protein